MYQGKELDNINEINRHFQDKIRLDSRKAEGTQTESSLECKLCAATEAEAREKS